MSATEDREAARSVLLHLAKDAVDDRVKLDAAVSLLADIRDEARDARTGR